MVCQLVRSISSDSCYNCTLYFQKGYLIVEEILRISCICRSTCPSLRVAFVAITEHECNTGRVCFAASGALHQGDETVDGPDIIAATITRSHGKASWDFVIKHI